MRVALVLRMLHLERRVLPRLVAKPACARSNSIRFPHRHRWRKSSAARACDGAMEGTSAGVHDLPQRIADEVLLGSYSMRAPALLSRVIGNA
eukprot:6207870-Pleurochrysis_carterae.AAC.2